MAELPLDAIFDILSRLPARSLARFRCASKSWCKCIDDDYFGILHAERAVEELTPIMYDPKLSCIIDFDIIKSKGGNTTLESKKKGMSLNRKFLFESYPWHSRYSVGGSCNGLLYLFSGQNYFSTTNLAVIHPLKLEVYKLPPTMHQEWEYSRGLGFDVSTNTFKMVCVLTKRRSKFTTFNSTGENLCTIVHVLGMDHSWREIPQVPPYPTYGDGIFAHGCLYWLGPYHESQSDTKYQGELICFEIRNEEFTLIYPPKRRCDYYLTNHLVDLHGEVGYAYGYHDNIIQVWVLKQNQWTNHCHFSIKQSAGVLDRWSKLDKDIYIGQVCHLKVLGRWSKDGDILIENSVMRKLFVYSLKSRLFSEVKIVGKEYRPGLYMYMYPESSMFSIRGINKTTHSIKTGLNAG